MDIEKLIEDLRGLLKQYGEKIPYGELVGAPWPYSRAGDLVWQDPEPYFIEQAATALSTLQTENNGLKEKLYDGEGVNLVDYWMQQAKIEENGHRNCQAENEKLRAELEQVKRENDALWTYIEIVDREYRRYMDRGYIDRLDELKKVWKRGQKED